MSWLARLFGGAGRAVAAVWRALIAAAPVRLWALLLAGPPLTVLSAWLIWIVWKGPWPREAFAQQLDILGYALFAALGLIGIIVISLAAVKVKGSGPGGLQFEVDADDDDAPAALAVTTTTETRIEPAAAPTEIPPGERIKVP